MLALIVYDNFVWKWKDLGLSNTADTFSYLSRYALFENQTVGTNYLNNIPGYVFKLTPKNSTTSPLFPYPLLQKISLKYLFFLFLWRYPTYRPLGPTTNNKSYLQAALTALVNAIQFNKSREYLYITFNLLI